MVRLVTHPECRHGHEVPGKNDQVGVQAADHADRSVQGMLRKVGIVMEVAEQCYGESLQARKPPAKGYFLAHDSGTIRLNQHGIDGERRASGGSRETNEVPPGSGKKRQSVLQPLH